MSSENSQDVHKADLPEDRQRQPLPQMSNGGGAMDETMAFAGKSEGKSDETGRQKQETPLRFGNYELLDQIGKGGMGVVYRARQLSADRIVALKVIRRDRLEALPRDTQTAALDRFRHEAQAAARLEHENIVTVYEVGEVAGEQFFSMRYVEGRSLAELLGDGPLENRRAAAYMEPVSRAVEEAHSRGILHRDLKPQNILVDSRADRALVADFGLAKLSEGAEQLTRAGEVIGTPPYMSPEQVRDSARVGVEMDVYALGATLYHVLTGRPPFQAATPVETLRQIIDEEPAPPRQLNPSIDRDLETICLKCLQKEPARRYPSAQSLADDLRRYLDGKPILARPVGTLGRTVRWCRRNPGTATLLGSTATFLVLALVATAVGYVKTSSALGVAEEAQRQSEKSFRQARGAVDNFFTRVSEDTLLNQPGMQPLRKELLAEALDYYQQFLSQRGGDPAIRDELAGTYFRVGRITEEIGAAQQALASYRQALAMQRELVRQRPADRECLAALGDTCNAVGKVLVRMHKLADALDTFGEAVVIRRQLAQSDPEDDESNRTLANSYMNLGLVEKERGNAEAARGQFERAQAIRSELLQRNPDDHKTRRDLGIGCFNLANLALSAGDHASARPNLEAAKAVFEKLLQNHPEELANQHRLAICCRVLADLNGHTGDHDSALGLYQEALRRMETLAGANPDVPEYQAALAGLQLNLGELYREQGQATTALESFQRALDILQTLADEYPKVCRYGRDLAVTLLAIAAVQSARGDRQAAMAGLHSARELLGRLLRQFPRTEEFNVLLEQATAEIDRLEAAPLNSSM